MLQIVDLAKLRFTKIRYYRINFRYDGILYSLNSHEDGGDYSLILWNRDSYDIVVSNYDYLRLSEYIKTDYGRRKSLIYSHINKEYFAEAINRFIRDNQRTIN